VKSDSELRSVADGILNGQIFATNTRDGIKCAFGVFLMFADKLPDDIGLLYEYIERSAPRSVNGYPAFYSCRVLSAAETVRLYQLLDEMDPDWRRKPLHSDLGILEFANGEKPASDAGMTVADGEVPAVGRRESQ